MKIRTSPRLFSITLALALAGLVTVARPGGEVQTATPQAPRVTAQRLSQNPLITSSLSASLGDNINGPAVVRVPPWVKAPLGRYYMYFAHHMGAFIRLAYAESIAGPWHIYAPGVVAVRDTAFYRPQPDPPENLENFYTHVASPELYVDTAQQRLILWFHGWYTDGQRWPTGETEARAWAAQHGYGQFTQVAESGDGLAFNVRPAISRTSYLRIFRQDEYFYGLARLGLLVRTRDPLSRFEPGANPFRGGPHAGRVRHVAVTRRGNLLYVFFTAIGDAPERIMVSTIDLRGDWGDWRASEPGEVLRPEAAYECTGQPNVPSEAGDVKGAVRQLRDPALFEEDGRTYLFYSYCGEQGIAAAQLTFADMP